MRLTLSLLGLELDVSLGPATTEAADDPAAALNGGTLGSTPVGFVAQWAATEDVPMPQRVPGWDEPEEVGR